MADHMNPASGGPRLKQRDPCIHDSTRADGTLDGHCLRCGADGWWHMGQDHDG